MKVIIGTDFSETAGAAGSVAAAMAVRWRDTLVLAHAFDRDGGLSLPLEIRETLAANAVERLHSEAVSLGRPNLHIEEHMLSGSAYLALDTFAKREDARLLVVSSAGRDSPWLLGSVAERVAERVPVPTLVVRDAVALEKWISGEKPLKVFVAFDFTQTAEKALRWVKHLQEVGSCQIIVGYVDWPLADERRLGMWWPPLASHNPPKVQEILTRELRSHAVKILQQINVTVRCEPSLGKPDSRLIEIASAEHADLIVTGAHQHEEISQLLNGSVSRALLRASPTNVLCVPAACAELIPAESAAIHRVLVAVDIDEGGAAALPFAYEIVRNGGTVRVVHVTAPFEASMPSAGGYPPVLLSTTEDHADMLAAIRTRLNALVPADAPTRRVTTEIKVIEAHGVAKAIRQEAERFCADVICVGAQRRSALSRAVLGSVAQDVATHSGRPVLVVHHKPV